MNSQKTLICTDEKYIKISNMLKDDVKENLEYHIEINKNTSFYNLLKKTTYGIIKNLVNNLRHMSYSSLYETTKNKNFNNSINICK
jgi:hypothetical protein